MLEVTCIVHSERAYERFNAYKQPFTTIFTMSEHMDIKQFIWSRHIIGDLPGSEPFGCSQIFALEAELE